jgi:hypothetical protein
MLERLDRGKSSSFFSNIHELCTGEVSKHLAQVLFSVFKNIFYEDHKQEEDSLEDSNDDTFFTFTLFSPSGPSVIKHFTAAIYKCLLLAGLSNLVYCFRVKLQHTQVKHLSGFSL